MIKKLIFIGILVLAGSSSAYADGFTCMAKNGSLGVQAFDYLQAADGTRTGAILILSDPHSLPGEQTIARFSDDDGTLSNNGSDYVARVDLRFDDQKNKETLVAGKYELDELDTVELEVAPNYDEPVQADQALTAVISLNARDGSSLSLDATCERYLTFTRLVAEPRGR